MSYSDMPDGPGGPGGSRSLGQLVTEILASIATLLRAEIELITLQMKEKAARLSAGGGLLVAAGVLALYMLGMFFAAAAWALSQVLPIWAAFLIIGFVLLIAVAVLGAIGIQLIKKSPESHISAAEDLQKIVDATKKGLNL